MVCKDNTKDKKKYEVGKLNICIGFGNSNVNNLELLKIKSFSLQEVSSLYVKVPSLSQLWFPIVARFLFIS